MPLGHLIDELSATIALAAGSPTIVLLVGVGDASVEPARAPLKALLQAAGSFRVQDLGQVTPERGPRAWAGAASAGAADVFMLACEPTSELAARSLARRLNGEREHLRQLGGPLLLLMNTVSERELRQFAPDFFTWVGSALELPTVEELRALAAARDVGSGIGDAAGVLTPASPAVRFLHLSDIHFKTDAVSARDLRKVLDGLLRYLDGDRAQAPLDLVCFTGDLAFSGDTREYEAASAFLRDLLATTGVPASRLFVVPGNHDVARRAGKWLLRTPATAHQAEEFFLDPGSRPGRARLPKGKSAGRSGRPPKPVCRGGGHNSAERRHPPPIRGGTMGGFQPLDTSKNTLRKTRPPWGAAGSTSRSSRPTGRR